MDNQKDTRPESAADAAPPGPATPPVAAVLAMQTAMLCWFLHLALPMVEVAGSAVAGWRVVVVGGHAALSLFTWVAPTDRLVLAGSALTAAEMLLAGLMLIGLVRRRPPGMTLIGLALLVAASQTAALAIGRPLIDGLAPALWLWPAATALWLIAGWLLRPTRG